jgi:23S rRNA pseudouridine1911/1915/1917 synthase
MDMVEFSWLSDEPNHKEALQAVLKCSGQLLKKHFSSKELNRSYKAHSVSRLPLDLVNHLMINPEFQGPLPRILEERANYLVLHKPSGVHSHPLCYSDKDTLMNYLAHAGQWESLTVNPTSYDRGLIFRLDYETSGLMLVAKNEKFFEEMRTGFKERMKRKIYWAIVDGDFDQDGSWTHFFRATGVKGAKQKVDLHPHPDADEGSLVVKKIAFKDGKSLVLVNLKTGLRHQIRAQLSALGFPILGDELYGGKKAERLFLHALRYEWDQDAVEDLAADLFDSFFDLHSALKVSHDVLSVFQRS